MRGTRDRDRAGRLRALGREPHGRRPREGRRAARGRATAACACHTTDGTPHLGPTWRGLYRKQVTLANGRDVSRRRCVPDRVDDGSRGEAWSPAASRSCRRTWACSSAARRRCDRRVHPFAVARLRSRVSACTQTPVTPVVQKGDRDRGDRSGPTPSGCAAGSSRTITSASASCIWSGARVRCCSAACSRSCSGSSSSTPGQRARRRAYLQPAVHASRRGDGVAVHDPVDPGGVRQLPPADHDRREGRRVPAAQPRELLVYLVGAHPRARRDDRSAASTPAGRSTRRTARRRPTASRSRSLGVFIIGLSSIMTGLNFIVDRPHDAREGHALVRACRCSCGRSTRRASSRCSRRRCSGSSLCSSRSITPGRSGIFDPATRRRPGAVPAPVLVLLASRRLHHDPAGDGRGQRDRVHVLRTSAVSYRAHRVFVARHRVRRLPDVGPPHVRRGHVDVRRRRVRRAVDARRDLLRDQGVHLDRTLYGGSHHDRDADPLRVRVHVPVRVRRHDRRRGRDASASTSTGTTPTSSSRTFTSSWSAAR